MLVLQGARYHVANLRRRILHVSAHKSHFTTSNHSSYNFRQLVLHSAASRRLSLDVYIRQYTDGAPTQRQQFARLQIALQKHRTLRLSYDGYFLAILINLYNLFYKFHNFHNSDGPPRPQQGMIWAPPCDLNLLDMRAWPS